MAGGSAKTEGGTAVKETVPVAQATIDEAVLPERVQEALGQLVGAAKEELLALSVGVGLGVLSSMMEEEVDDIIGPKGKHNPNRVAVRLGHDDGEVTLGGRRVEVRRPRARTADGESEVPLQRYEHFTDRDPMSRVVLERMLAGVSTRRYRRTQEPVGEEVEVRRGRRRSRRCPERRGAHPDRALRVDVTPARGSAPGGDDARRAGAEGPDDDRRAWGSRPRA